MLNSPEFRRQMLDPNFIRQMNQMQRMMGGNQQQRLAFPAPGPTTGSDTTSGNTTTTTDTSQPATGTNIPGLPDMSQMMQMFGGGAQVPGAPGQSGDASAQNNANPFAQMMQNPALLQSMFSGMGGAGGIGQPAETTPADTRPPEERVRLTPCLLDELIFS